MFISYRRSDASWAAVSVYDALRTKLPPDSVFMDIDSIPIGVDFVEYLDGWVRQCDVVLVMIGPNWLNAADPKTGQRRLDNPSDFVRIEIRQALARGIPVVPVLIDGTGMPPASQLPEDIRTLARRNAAFVYTRSKDSDLTKLVRDLELDAPGLPKSRATSEPAFARPNRKDETDTVERSRRLLGFGAVGAVAAVGTALFFFPPAKSDRPIAIEQSSSDSGIAVEQDAGVVVAAKTTAAPPPAEKSAPRRSKPTTKKPTTRVSKSTSTKPKPSAGTELPPGTWTEGRDKFGTYADVVIPGTKAKFRMRWIEPGTFVMGSPATEEGRTGEEGPRHKVTLRQGFWMADAECTQAVYEAVMGKNPSFFKGADRPVEQVSWHDVQAFLTKLNARIPGFEARLPTEAEWEYAARARTTKARYGDFDAIAWHWDNSAGETYPATHPVKQKQPNAWGLYDMLGNVWEWCADWKGPYDSGHAYDPIGPSKGVRRVARGGSWFNGAQNVRAAFRLARDPSFRDFLGFRFVRGRAAPEAQ